jgi:alpha-beta hydrolase superfamily lysophospholipase
MILLHGGGGNGRVLSPFAIMSQKFGCEVVAPDLPGYGLSVRTRNTKPTYEKWSIIVSDLINQEIEKDGLPVFVWGLSIGGFLAYMVAARNKKVSGMIATTLADTRKIGTILKTSKNRLLGLGGLLLMKILGSLLNPIKLPIKWLTPMALISNDPDVSKVFMKDRLAGGSLVRWGFLRSLVNAKPLIEPNEFYQCPVLLVHPEIDPWTPLDLSMKFFDKIAASKSVVVLEGCGHFPIEFPGKTKLEKSIESFVLSNIKNNH